MHRAELLATGDHGPQVVGRHGRRAVRHGGGGGCGGRGGRETLGEHLGCPVHGGGRRGAGPREAVGRHHVDSGPAVVGEVDGEGHGSGRGERADDETRERA